MGLEKVTKGGVASLTKVKGRTGKVEGTIVGTRGKPLRRGRMLNPVVTTETLFHPGRKGVGAERRLGESSNVMARGGHQ